MGKTTLTAINKDLKEFIEANSEFKVLEQTKKKLGQLISKYDEKLVDDIVVELEKVLNDYLKDNNEEEIKQLYEMAKEEYEKKKEQAGKLRTEQSRKELLEAIREKKEIENILKKIERLKNIIQAFQTIKNELYNNFIAKQKKTKRNIFKKDFSSTSSKKEKITKIKNNIEKVSIDDILKLDNKEDIETIIKKEYNNLSDKDKLLICKFLLDKGFDSEFVKKYFSQIKLINIKQDKYIDLWGEIDEKINKDIITLGEFKNYTNTFLNQKGVKYLDKLKVEDFFEFYKIIANKKLIFNKGNISKPKHRKEITFALERFFSDKQKGLILYNLLKESDLYTNHERYFFVKCYPDLDYILENENNLGIVSSCNFIIRYIKSNDYNKETLKEYLQQILLKLECKNTLSFFKKSELKRLINFLEEKSVFIDYASKIEEKIYNKTKDFAEREKHMVKEVVTEQLIPERESTLFEKYMSGKLRGRNSKQQIEEMFSLLTAEEFIQILEKDRKNFFQKKEYYFDLVYGKLVLFRKEIILLKGENYIEEIKNDMKKYFNIHKYPSERIIKIVKYDFYNIDNIKLAYENMNKFLFIRKLNEEYGKLDDSLKLEICIFLLDKGNKKEFIKKYFGKIELGNISDKNMYYELKSKIIEPKVIQVKIEKNNTESKNNDEIDILFEKYLEGRLRGSGSKEKIIKMIKGLNVTQLIQLILNDIDKLYQKKDYYFIALNNKLENLRNKIIDLKGREWLDKVYCSLRRQRNCFNLDEVNNENLSKETAKDAFGSSVVSVPIRRKSVRKQYGRTSEKGKILKGEEKLKAEIDFMIKYYLSKYLKLDFSSTTKQKWLEFVSKHKSNNYFLNKLADFLVDKETLTNLFLDDMLENDIFLTCYLKVENEFQKIEKIKESKLEFTIKKLNKLASFDEVVILYKSVSVYFNNFEKQNKELASKLYLLFLEKINLFLKENSKYRIKSYINTLTKRLNKLDIDYELGDNLRKYLSKLSNQKNKEEVDEKVLTGIEKEQKIILDNLKNKQLANDSKSWYSKGIEKLEKYIEEKKEIDEKFMLKLIQVLKPNDIFYFMDKGFFSTSNCMINIYYKLVNDKFPIIDKKNYKLLEDLYKYMMNISYKKISEEFNVSKTIYLQRLRTNFEKLINLNPGLEIDFN